MYSEASAPATKKPSTLEAGDDPDGSPERADVVVEEGASDTVGATMTPDIGMKCFVMARIAKAVNKARNVNTN